MAGAVTLYGIPNCDQVRLARAWLDARKIEYRFHDFKREGLACALATRWIEAAGLEALLNRRGTTWRKLDDSERAGATSTSGARDLMTAHPSIVKRPVLDSGGRIAVGFSAQTWETLF